MKTLKEYFGYKFKSNICTSVLLTDYKGFKEMLKQIRHDIPNAIEFTKFIDSELNKLEKIETRKPEVK